MPLPDPHSGQPVLTAGEPFETAQAAMILVHGRNADAASILELTREVGQPGLAYLAPQAAGNTWYPYSFLSPIEQNEPYLSSALKVIETVLARLTAAGLPPERTLLLGFSQGACLTLEFAARQARRYGGVVGLSGGLIGPDATPRDYAGSLAGTPIFLGCSNVDFHIPKTRVQHSTEVLRRIGGEVTERLYPGLGHTVNHDEIKIVREMLTRLRRTEA